MPMESGETQTYEPREDFRTNEKVCVAWQLVDGNLSSIWILVSYAVIQLLVIRFPKTE